MDNSTAEREHDSFDLRTEKKQNGRKITRIILYAHCMCGFRTKRYLVRVFNKRGRKTKETISDLNEKTKAVEREYLSHLNGRYV